ncbi:MAG TPA: DUF5320 domain-containing protein [Chitinispirillaceae bacterium]|nr:DUF5320 domain-containing protein [Chitinispirillaceae bacterium]
MPRGDRTGPMTDRGAGFCAGYGTPGFMNAIPTECRIHCIGKENVS